MKLSEAGELSLLEFIRKRFGKKSQNLILGIGDDSAVIKPENSNFLITTDMMVEDVHFDFRWTTPFQLGFKLVSVNVSDIYAMGGRPSFMLLNLGAPGDMNVKIFNSLFDGIEEALRTYNLSLIGGDLSSSKKIVLSATVTGYAKKFIGRKGAKAGDKIYVTGCLGDSSCGLELLKRAKKIVEIQNTKKFIRKAPSPSPSPSRGDGNNTTPPLRGGDKGEGDVCGFTNDRINKGGSLCGLKGEVVLPLVKRHLRPLAKKPDKFIGKATSMIDISDGLIIDLTRLCKESKTGATIHIDRIPISKELWEASAHLRVPALDFVLAGGEDYELLFTAPKNKKVRAFCIGEITESGIKVINEKGKAINTGKKGYQHFAV